MTFMGEGVSASLSNVVLLIKATLSCKLIMKGALPRLHYLSFPLSFMHTLVAKTGKQLEQV